MVDPKARSKFLFLFFPVARELTSLRYESGAPPRVADSHVYALRDARARAGTHVVHHPQGEFLCSLSHISFPYTLGTPAISGGVASLARPTQNGDVDLATIHAH